MDEDDLDPARRRWLQGAGAALATAGAGVNAQTGPRSPIRPPRLRPGDTIGLINPSNAIHERAPFDTAIESIRALGFQVRLGAHARARYGHFAGTDVQRAADVNAMFADPQVNGVLAITGGSGGTRMMGLVDYELIRRNPKFFGGFSDLTALINAIHARTGLVTFHAPMADSEWNPFSVDIFRAMLVDGQALTLANPRGRADVLVPKGDRTTTLRGGKARGPMIGGNLAVLAAMVGSRQWPSFDGAILFLEDVNEWIYRVDRMLSTLRNAGAFDRLAGVVLGAFTKCEPGDGFGTLTLDEVFDDYFLPLNVPVYRGAMIGHIARKFTVPIGWPVEMDADAGTIRLLQPAVV